VRVRIGKGKTEWMRKTEESVGAGAGAGVGGEDGRRSWEDEKRYGGMWTRDAGRCLEDFACDDGSRFFDSKGGSRSAWCDFTAVHTSM